jgi:hypothetical protein
LLDRAEKKGIQKNKVTVVKSLLTETEFCIAKIASLVDVSEEMVKKIKKELQGN